MALPTTGVEICNIALGLIGWAEPITAIDGDSNKADRMCNRFYSITFQEMLELFAWGAVFERRPLILTAGFKEFNDKFGTTAPTISGITKANPGVITAAGHGFSTGHFGYIYDVSGMTEINTSDYGEVFYLIATDVNTLTLGINTTNFTAYTSGGSIVRLQPHSKYSSGYTYVVPSDFILGVSLENPASEYEIMLNAGSLELMTITENAVLSYVKALSDDEAFTNLTALFLNTFTIRLAMKLSLSILGAKVGSIIKEELRKDYIEALNEAEIAEAKSVNVQADTTDPFITARK